LKITYISRPDPIISPFFSLTIIQLVIVDKINVKKRHFLSLILTDNYELL